MKKAILFVLVAAMVLSLAPVCFASPTQDGFSLNVVKRFADLKVDGRGDSGASWEYSLSQGGVLGLDKKLRVEEKSNDNFRLSAIEGAFYHNLGDNVYLNLGARNYQLKDKAAGESKNKFTLQAGVEVRQPVAGGAYTYAGLTVGKDMTDMELGLAYDLPFATLDVNYRSEKINNIKVAGQDRDTASEGVGLGLTFHF